MTTSVDVRKVTVQRFGKYKVLGSYTDTHQDAFTARAKIVSMNGKIEIKFDVPHEILPKDRIRVGELIYDITKGIGKNVNSVYGKKNEFECGFSQFQKLGMASYGKIEALGTEIKNATDAFMDSWVGTFAKNIAENYQTLKVGKSITKFQAMLNRDIPCACVGAGPSLDGNVEWLKDFPGLIMVADRAYKSLLARKIEPDFVIATDCHYDLIRDMLDCPLSYRHKLILNTASDPQISKVWKGQIFYYNMKHPGQQFMDRILPAVLPKIGALNCVGCVGNTSIVFADYIGCGDIILVGQDFGYTGGRMHADAYEIKADGSAVKKYTNHKKLLEKRTGKVYVNDVLTYFPYKENMLTTYALAKMDGLKITNCTEGGIIENLPKMPLKEMVQKLTAEGKMNLVNKARKQIAKRGGI